jgi:hypothetical protein
MTNDPNPILHLPSNLTVWMGERILAGLTLEITSELGHAMLRDESPNSQWHTIGPQMLLGLLTYCYATGVLSSNEIAESAAQAGMIRYLSAYTLPEAKILKAFRRRWHPLLRQSLIVLFNRAWGYHFGNPCASTHFKQFPEFPCPIHEARRFFEEESELRIRRAIHLDTIEADV